PRAVLMIDDFQVPGDPGYSFDDYGPGKALTSEYLPELNGWGLFYPCAPSSSETGARRGCAVLATPPMSSVVQNIKALRSA
ncbi:MAG: hypothetical protein ACREMY_22235, partial [bacterium]